MENSFQFFFYWECWKIMANVTPINDHRKTLISKVKLFNLLITYYMTQVKNCAIIICIIWNWSLTKVHGKKLPGNLCCSERVLCNRGKDDTLFFLCEFFAGHDQCFCLIIHVKITSFILYEAGHLHIQNETLWVAISLSKDNKEHKSIYENLSTKNQNRQKELSPIQ